MPHTVQVQLLPLDKTIEVELGASVQDAVFAEGVECPCGGRGRCKGCRIKVLKGHLSLTSEDQHFFTEAELAEGWRLACRARAEGDLKIELAQWEAAILTDHRSEEHTSELQ